MNRRRLSVLPTLVGGGLAALVLGLVGPAAPTAARPATERPATDREMPFPCGQKWRGSTRPSHSPSAWSVDWNSADDLGRRTVAAAAGTVAKVEDLGGRSYGLHVVLDHGDGASTLYAHLSTVGVTVGQRLDQGQLVGAVGGSGNVTGPHLHFEERQDGEGRPPWFGGEPFVMGSTQVSGNCVETPLAADLAGDGRAELVVFRRGPSGRFLVEGPDGAEDLARLGLGTDDPLLGDWDGDGRVDLGVRRPRSSTFVLRAGDGTLRRILLGRPSDVGVAGDWDGDRATDVGVWRPAAAAFRLRSGDGTVTQVRLGATSSVPVTGDWDGDGRTDLAAYDPATATWSLRVLGTSVRTGSVVLGAPGHLPVAGDWDGDGATDLGAWDPSTATWTFRRAEPLSVLGGRLSTRVFGRPR